MSRLLILAMQDPATASRLASEIAAANPALRVIGFDRAEFPQLAENVSPPWLFIDWLLPEMSGLELARRIRQDRPASGVHLTMILEGADAECRRRALAAGADDYMPGPLTAAAVLERVATGAGLRHALPPASVRLREGTITLDPAAFQTRYDGRLIALRPNEFRLLAHFAEHPDQVFSRLALIESLGKQEEEIDERTVDVWVGRLRRALRAQNVPDPLRTVRSYGYVLDSPHS